MSEEITAPRHVVWDFERGQAIAYERQGECQKCGECCLGAIHIEGNGAKEPARGNVRHTSVWCEPPKDEKGRQYYRVEEVEHSGVACRNLTDKKLCDARSNGDYAPICQAWPISPVHQLMFPTCGYSFAEMERWGWDKTPGRVIVLD